ncbi:MAG: DUF2139 domain-containing protein [Nitrososphaeria archaeon]
MANITQKDHRFPPRYGPEWGSGGIFGLKYFKSTLFFNLAFEGEAHFLDEEGEIIYKYGLVGPEPVSGGDTYNAVDVVDDFIYFGGWVHAPAKYIKKGERKTISFTNKYSHVHQFDTKEKQVKLVWKETINSETDWTGEVSNIVYNPVDDNLLLSRADGHTNLGVYSLDRRTGVISQLSSDPSVKGTLFLDSVCFDISSIGDFRGIQHVDLQTNNWSKIRINDMKKISIDKGDVIKPFVGAMASAYAQLFTFIKGGVVIGNPLDGTEDSIQFIRLFDFVLSGYSPSRTTAIPVGGGILTSFNAFTHGLVNPMNEEEKKAMEAGNTIIGPSVLVYITPPIARIVGVFGARITSIENCFKKILLGTSTTANLGMFNATPIDAGYREIIAIDEGILSAPSPPTYYSIPGHRVLNQTWGGIPLFGYKDPKFRIKSSKTNRVHIFEYDLGIPIQPPEETTYELHEGINILDLNGFNRIVSFKFDEEDLKSMIYISLI